jgi:hypothetical protein
MALASARRGRSIMPWKTTLKRAAKAKREGKRPTTVAGEFVREEMEHVRRGKHGARSPQQAIAIGLSKARRAGVRLPPPKRGRAKLKTIQSAKAASRAARTRGTRRPSARRSRATSRALKREPRSTASRPALARQARAAARRRRRFGAATPGVRPLASASTSKRRRRTQGGSKSRKRR